MTTLLFKINEKRKPKEIYTTNKLVLTLGGEAFMSGIPGRTSPEPNKKGSIFNPGSLRICSSPCLLQSALDDLKRHLLRNGYPRGIISYNMNDVINKHRNKPKDIITVPKKEIFIVLPYLGIQSKSCIYKSCGCVGLSNSLFRKLGFGTKYASG